jgi:hypothetical protein
MTPILELRIVKVTLATAGGGTGKRKVGIELIAIYEAQCRFSG